MIVRHIDTARMYRNEQAVGEAVRESGVPRGQIFISTRSHLCMLGMSTALGLTSCAYTASKVDSREHGSDVTPKAIEDSVQKIGLGTRYYSSLRATA